MVSSGASERAATFFHPPLAEGLHYELWLRRLPCDRVSAGTAYQFDASPGTGNNLVNRGAAMKQVANATTVGESKILRLVTLAILPGSRECFVGCAFLARREGGTVFRVRSIKPLHHRSL
jgi:hypothetical protein